jgi:hypothetical protein
MYNLLVIGPYDAILLTYEHNKTIDEDIIKTKAFYSQITRKFIFAKFSEKLNRIPIKENKGEDKIR